jgi:hypothetical protein
VTALLCITRRIYPEVARHHNGEGQQHDEASPEKQPHGAYGRIWKSM